MNFLFDSPHIIGQHALCPSMPPASPPAASFSLAAIRTPDIFSDSVSTFLFESHWLWWIAILAVAATLFYVGRARADKRLFTAALIAAAVTGAWILLALAFDSPAERLYAAHRGLATAAASQDVPKMLTYLAPEIRVPTVGLTGQVPPADQIAELINRYGIRDSKITYYKLGRQQRTASTEVTFVTQTNMGYIKTAWRLSWNDFSGEDWKIVRGDLLRINDQPLPRDFVVP